MIACQDVFLSHSADSRSELVVRIAREAEAFNLKCWYAERDIKGGKNYTGLLTEAIEQSRLFVLLLDKFSLRSEHVTREVNIAMDKRKPLLIIRLDECSLKDNNVTYVASASSQVVTMIEPNESALAQNICKEILEWFQEHDEAFDIFDEASRAIYKSSWDVNDLEFFGDEGERARIDLQHQFVYTFAKDAYDRLLTDLSGASFLDVGCNTAVQSKMFLENKPLKHYIGIDREAAALEQAQLTFPQGHMYVCNCEAEDFSARLYEIERELGISGFDVINVSLLLLHTRNPSILIDVLSDHLSEDGRIIVLDIDDGFNIAYPDPEGLFEKAIYLCRKTEYSGYRHCGRTINKFLSDTDLHDIQLHKIGLSNIGMSRKEKEDFFDIYFWFILDDLKKMSEEKPNDIYAAADYAWMKSNYSKMKACFKKRDFFFNLGFVLYSAHA